VSKAALRTVTHAARHTYTRICSQEKKETKKERRGKS
jgi:hypothetical protein